MAVEMTREAIRERLETQDNRCTAQPIYVVQQRERIYGMDPDWTDHTVWVDTCNDYDEASEEEVKELEAVGDATGCWEKFGYIDRWKLVSVFLTHDAAQEYIDSQRHNLTDPRIYVDSGWRNREWIALRQMFLEPPNQEPPAPADKVTQTTPGRGVSANEGD